MYQNRCYLTKELPGIGGSLRTTPEDFLVNEIPLSLPEGTGEHLYIWLEKRRLSTFDSIRAIARILEVKESVIGYAGMKDSFAVTRQWLSVPTQAVDAAQKLKRLNENSEKVLRVLKVCRGRAKLRRGALAGNQFDIRVRGVLPNAAGYARAILEVLTVRGVPNAFGDQRFGVMENSARVGGAIALGEWDLAIDYLLGGSESVNGVASKDGDSAGPIAEAVRRFNVGDLKGALAFYPGGWRAERCVLVALIGCAAAKKAVRAIPRREKKLFASAFQAAIFNTCLAWRLSDDTHDRILVGDVVVSHRSRNIWRVGDPEKEAGVLARFEASPAGPLIGEKMLEARGEPGETEAEIYDSLSCNLGSTNLGLAKMGVRGGRRPYRVKVVNPVVIEDGADLRIRFDLPAGAYGTEVLRELMKVELPLQARYDFVSPNWGKSFRRKFGGEK